MSSVSFLSGKMETQSIVKFGVNGTDIQSIEAYGAYLSNVHTSGTYIGTCGTYLPKQYSVSQPSYPGALLQALLITGTPLLTAWPRYVRGRVTCPNDGE